jgi:hypothetical protein
MIVIIETESPRPTASINAAYLTVNPPRLPSTLPSNSPSEVPPNTPVVGKSGVPATRVTPFSAVPFTTPVNVAIWHCLSGELQEFPAI